MNKIKLLALLGALAMPILAQESTKAGMLWYSSIGALAGGSAADGLSSLGLCELNPILKSSDGKFENKAVAIKVVTFAWLVGAQFMLRHKVNKKIFIMMNYGGGAVFGASAWRNGGIKAGGTCR